MIVGNREAVLMVDLIGNEGEEDGGKESKLVQVTLQLELQLVLYTSKQHTKKRERVERLYFSAVYKGQQASFVFFFFLV